MNNRILLSLVAMPAVGSTLAMMMAGGMASAAEVSRTDFQRINTPSSAAAASCDAAQSELSSSAMRQSGHPVLIASSAGPGEYPIADFSEAESDAAVALFGCDCLSCINALRQLRSQSLDLMPTSYQGHCWTSLQQRVSPQEVQDLLQTLEAEEAN
ncbi:hypothetical protein IFO70_23425 [Phormidium tenue FACHB-886]|nr:hypothetical protein [Phormidium tenue FACHB-886]